MSALCASLLSLALPPTTAMATSTQEQVDTAVNDAVEYVRAQQDPTTGEPLGFEHGPFSSDWVATALAAAGVNSADVAGGGGASLQDFLSAEYGESPGWWTGIPNFTVEGYARATLVAYGAGIDPARVSADSNLPAQIAGTWNPAAGSFGEPNVEAAALGILALATTPTPAWALGPAVSYLRQSQEGDGTWTYLVRTPAEMTGAAIAALCATGVPAYDPQVASALAYLRGQQIEATGAIESGNAESTARVLSGLNACGIDPQSTAWTTTTGKTPVDYLLSLQAPSGPEAGGFAYETGEPPNLYSTGEALRAIAGGVFTAPPPPRSDPSQPSVRPAPTVAAGTPVPHLLAIELAPGNVRICKLTAPARAPLAQVLSAVKAGSYPAGCVTSFSAADGHVESIDGVSPPGEDETWLLRLDRSAETPAGDQPVGFGDLIALRIGKSPENSPGSPAATGPVGPAGPAGGAGHPGPRGRRGERGRPGRNARIACRVRRHRYGRQRIRCTVKHRRRGRQASH
jgi:hypothetical protein